jgi:citrate lyase synthetase
MTRVACFSLLFLTISGSAARGSGVGRKIVTTLSDVAKSAGCYKVILFRRVTRFSASCTIKKGCSRL